MYRLAVFLFIQRSVFFSLVSLFVYLHSCHTFCCTCSIFVQKNSLSPLRSVRYDNEWTLLFSVLNWIYELRWLHMEQKVNMSVLHHRFITSFVCGRKWSVFTLGCISAKIDKVSQYSDNSTTTGAKKRNTSYLNVWTWPNHTINKSITRPRLAFRNFFSSYFQNIYVIQIKLWVLLLLVRKRDQLWWNQSTRSAGSFKTSIIFTFF